MTLLARLLDPRGDKPAVMRLKRPLYSWVLSRSQAGNSLDVLPPDPWFGDMGRGRTLLGRVLDMQGTAIDLTPQIWADPKIASHPTQGPLIHSFEWLRDLRALGGDQPRKLGRTMMAEWLAANRYWRPYIWDYPVTGSRLAAWLMAYEFFCSSADDEFQETFQNVLLQQMAHLNRANPADFNGMDALNIIRGQIFTALTLREDITPYMMRLDAWLNTEIDAEGMHLTRSPSMTLRVARHLIDLRGGLVRAGIPAPTMLQSAIERIMHAARFFRMPDQKLSSLGGTQEGDADALEAIFRVSGVRVRKSPTNLSESGYQSLTREKTHVIVDCGNPPPPQYDKGAHASPLAFELSSGKERIVVTCGTSKIDPVWAEYMRATAAHSTLVMDDRNAYELIKGGGFGRAAGKVVAQRDITADGIVLNMSHDGYVPLNGLIHKRRLMLNGIGNVLEGEDILESDVPLVKPANFALRFHLHPRVQASLIQDGQVCLLRLPSGAGWRFYKDGGLMTLEPSIYCGAGDTPRKTSQIVISGTIENSLSMLRWQFVEER